MADVVFDFEELFERRANHILPGLERIRAAYNALGKPGSHIPTIIVAGTNGKGSTSAFVWKLLRQLGYNCGLYTSPHLRSFSERFVTGTGSEICDQDVYAEWQKLRNDLPAALYEALSFFEIATLIALRIFAARDCDFNILEVGMGGRWDATNIVNPVVSVVVGVDYDHQQFLGSDILQILHEKLGVLRPEVPAVIGGGGQILCNARVDEYLKNVIIEHRAPILKFARDVVLQDDSIQIGALKWNLDLNLKQRLPPHLRHNLSLSLAVLLSLSRLGLVQQTDAKLGEVNLRDVVDVLAQLGAVRGRHELIRVENLANHQLICDVAHNIDSVTQLLEALKPPFPEAVLFSIMADKDVDKVIDLLRGKFANCVLFRNKYARSVQNVPKAYASSVRFFPDLHMAWQHMVANLPRRSPWLICGSVAGVGEVFEYLRVGKANPHLNQYATASSPVLANCRADSPGA